MPFSCGNDTEAVALDLDVDGKLIASLILSTDDGNAAQIRANGLYVPGGTFEVALPGGPGNGDEVYYIASDADGVEWHLKYRATSASLYKWEFVGGAALYDEVAAIETLSGAAVAPDYVDIDTIGPRIVVPLEGDYDLEYGAMIDGAAAGTNTSAAPRFGVVPATFPYAIANYDTRFESLARAVRVTDLPAGTAIKLQYTKDDAADAQFGHRYLRVTPVRVTG